MLPGRLECVPKDFESGDDDGAARGQLDVEPRAANERKSADEKHNRGNHQTIRKIHFLLHIRDARVRDDGADVDAEVEPVEEGLLHLRPLLFVLLVVYKLIRA